MNQSVQKQHEVPLLVIHARSGRAEDDSSCSEIRFKSKRPLRRQPANPLLSLSRRSLRNCRKRFAQGIRRQRRSQNESVIGCITNCRGGRPEQRIANFVFHFRAKIRRREQLYVIEVATYPERRAQEQLVRDTMLVYLNYRVVPDAVAVVLRPKGRLQIPSAIASMLAPAAYASTSRDLAAAVEAKPVKPPDVYPATISTESPSGGSSTNRSPFGSVAAKRSKVKIAEVGANTRSA